MTETTGLQLLQQVRSAGPADRAVSDQKEQITVLDMVGDVASAKLVTTSLDRLHDAFEIRQRVKDRFGCS